MKKKELRIVNAILIVIFILFSLLTLSLSANSDLLSVFKDSLGGNNVETGKYGQNSEKQCRKEKPLTNLRTDDAQLRKLEEYQTVCNSFVSNRVMFFTSFPQDTKTALELSSQVANKLKAFKQSGVTPIAVVEPYIKSGAMSYQEYLRGTYDPAVGVFFNALAAEGVTEDMMGIWVPFPESNTPSWNNKDTEPSDFGLVVNKYLGALKKQFPKAEGSILLNATTYEPTDTEYENGDYISLVPYIQNIDKKLVSSIGIQGFPWVSRATAQRREIFRAAEFLQVDRAIEAAQELRTRDIWFNTGSFASKYTLNPKEQVDIVPADRKAILEGILEELKRVRTFQQNEYRVFVNIFAEDKSKKQEATNWSYFMNEDNKEVFRDFVTQLRTANINLAIYDD